MTIDEERNEIYRRARDTMRAQIEQLIVERETLEKRLAIIRKRRRLLAIVITGLSELIGESE